MQRNLYYRQIGWAALKEDGTPRTHTPPKQWWGQPADIPGRIYKSENSAKRYGTPVPLYVEVDDVILNRME